MKEIGGCSQVLLVRCLARRSGYTGVYNIWINTVKGYNNVAVKPPKQWLRTYWPDTRGSI